MILPKFSYIIIGFVVLIFVANLLFLDFFFIQQKSDLLDFQTRITQMADGIKTLGSRVPDQKSPSAPVPLDEKKSAGVPTSQLISASCPVSCISLITSATKSASNLVAPIVSQTEVSTKGEFVIPFGAGSATNSESSSTNWKTLDSAMAVFDAGNYGKIKSAYFEAFLHVGSAGEVHARILDTTTPEILWTSEASTNSLSTVFISKQITLKPGQKTYKIQLYSTMSTGFLDQGRVRIVTQ